MNPILEKKVRELMEEAERQGAPAMYTVLHLLYASYLEGKQNEFARHCCRLTPLNPLKVSVVERECSEDLRMEFDDEGFDDWPAEFDPKGPIN